MSDIWPTETIGDLFDIGAGKSVTPKARHGEPKHPFLRTSNVFWGRMDLREVDSMHFTKDEIASKSLRKGDLLVCEGGDIGRAAIWNGELTDCSFQNHIHRLRSKHKNIVSRFYMYYLQSGFTQLGIYEGAGNKTTIPNLSRNRLSALSVPKPDETEQNKIAALLWKIQRAIEVEDKLTATARELKQATMRQLFSCGLRGETQQETEIGPIPDSWSLRPLAELREFLQYGTSAKCEYAKQGDPVLRIPNILNGDIEVHDLKWCKLSAKEVDSWVLEQGDVLFIRTNGVRDRVGTCAVYHGQPEHSLFASYLIRARLKTDRLNPDYFQYFSNTPVGRAQLAGRASPAADGKFNVNTKNIDAVLIPLPKAPEEQSEIVNILRDLDHKIRLHERKRTSMQDLFGLAPKIETTG